MSCLLPAWGVGVGRARWKGPSCCSRAAWWRGRETPPAPCCAFGIDPSCLLPSPRRSEGLAKPGEPIELLVALVHSWKDVGQARIECKGGGCQCKAVDANLHWKQSTTQPSIVSVPATMVRGRVACRAAGVRPSATSPRPLSSTTRPRCPLPQRARHPHCCRPPPAPSGCRCSLRPQPRGTASSWLR